MVELTSSEYVDLLGDKPPQPIAVDDIKPEDLSVIGRFAADQAKETQQKGYLSRVRMGFKDSGGQGSRIDIHDAYHASANPSRIREILTPIQDKFKDEPQPPPKPDFLTEL